MEQGDLHLFRVTPQQQQHKSLVVIYHVTVPDYTWTSHLQIP